MRQTILVATLSAVAASVLTTAVISGSLFVAGTASSANSPAEAEGAVSPGGVTSILQGDINCDGVVDAQDALGDLRYVGGLDVQQDEPCPDVGTLAAIPGPQGPVGPQGEQGPPGPQGAVGLTDYEVVVKESNESVGTMGLDVPCPAGKKVTGGGARISGAAPPQNGVVIKESHPANDSSGWSLKVARLDIEPSGSAFTYWGYAICANVAVSRAPY